MIVTTVHKLYIKNGFQNSCKNDHQKRVIKIVLKWWSKAQPKKGVENVTATEMYKYRLSQITVANLTPIKPSYEVVRLIYLRTALNDRMQHRPHTGQCPLKVVFEYHEEQFYWTVQFQKSIFFFIPVAPNMYVIQFNAWITWHYSFHVFVILAMIYWSFSRNNSTLITSPIPKKPIFIVVCHLFS